MKKNILLLFTLFVGQILVGQTYTKSIISSNQAGGAFGLVEFEINGDNFLDLISASKTDNTLAFYINNGDGTFTQHIVDNSLNEASYGFAADIDGDSDMDFVGAGDAEIAWYENDGSNNFTKHNVANVSDTSFVIVYDIDSDGDGDIGAAISGEDYITAFLNNGSGSFSRVNAISTPNPKMFFSGDYNGDGTFDVLAPSFDNDKIEWYTFNGLYFAVGGTVTSNFDGVWWAEGADVDGDSDWDVVAASYNGNKISWFENDGTGTSFTEHVVDSNLNHAIYLRVIDLDGDSDMDIVATGNGNNGTGSEVAIYINDGSQNFTKTTVDNTELAPACVSVRDFTGDGTPDIAFASNMSNEYVLLTNTTSSVASNTKDLFSIYPNPAHQFIHIDTKKNVKTISIYDLTGRKILDDNQTDINISNLPQGNYLIKIIFNDGLSSTKKLLIY